MRLPIKVSMQRWPWQPGYRKSDAERGWGRFGGGWKFSIGLRVGGSTALLDLGFGSIRVVWGKYARE